MKTKQIFRIILFMLLSNAIAYSADDLQIAFDAATFHFDNNEAKWELYYTVPDNMFTYIANTDGKMIGILAIRMTIKSNITTIIDETWKVSNIISSTNELKQNYVFGAKSFFIPPGQYTLEISSFDENEPKRRVTYNNQIIISKFESNRINQSEIQFASYLEKISESKLELDPMYMKYDYYIIPNPRAEFFGNQSRLIGLCEIYNAEMFSPKGLIRSYKIADNTGLELYYHRDSTVNISESMLATFDIPLDTMYSGVYFLTMTSSYPFDNPTDSVSTTKKFYYYNQTKPPIAKRYFTENEIFEKSEFNTLNAEQTDLELAMAMVIANEQEIYQSRALTDTKAKQRFLFKFWASKNKDTINPWNETLRTFRRNVEFANNFFAYGKNRSGWKTERGRVLLKYGQPTQRDMHLGDGNERAYEEWFYEDVQGGVNFYFVDISRIGNFILVHSTAIEEPYYPDWFNRYVPASADKRNELEMQNERRSTNPYGN